MRISRVIALSVVGIGLAGGAFGAQQQPFSGPVAGSATNSVPVAADQSGKDEASFAAISRAALDRLVASAGAGDASAAMILARYFLGPDMTDEDRGKGLLYLEQAANAGLAEAHAWLGEVYSKGLHGVAPDLAKAVPHYEAAAASGNNIARRNYAALLLGGASDPATVDKALALLGDAVASGDIAAAIDLAEINAKGILVHGDGQKAIELYDRGVLADDLEAINGLADLYRLGGANIDPDPRKAASLYEQAAARGDQRAKQTLAEMYILGEGVSPSLDKGVALLEELAGEGKTSALVDLGDIFSNNEVAPPDLARAIDYYEQAVEAGDFSSLVRIGDLYSEGAVGFPPDVASAVPYYEEASDNDNIEAKRALAEILLKGASGVDADPARAVELLQSAADMGDRKAADMLAEVQAQTPAP